MCSNCQVNEKLSITLSFIIVVFVTNSSFIMGHRPTFTNLKFFQAVNNDNNKHQNISVISNTNIIALSDVLRRFRNNYSTYIDNYNEKNNNHMHNKHVNEKKPLFPKDIFSLEQRRNGAVLLHVLGVVYMFVALAIVCDEFFVPSLDVIIEKLDIADDVAGATFMAAGGSAPELFTSIIGVFVSFDDVGIGTIVGSAVFNILFVIGMCAIFSKTVLTLTWWPLFRDCTFYSMSLLTLIYFFRDNYIYWYEALILFLFYLVYVSFMKWNQSMEQFVKTVLFHNKVTRVRSTDQLMPMQHSCSTKNGQGHDKNVPCGCQSNVSTEEEKESFRCKKDNNTKNVTNDNSSSRKKNHEIQTKFRHGLLQLMIHTIDPLQDGNIDEKATQLHAIASLKVLLDATKSQRGTATSTSAIYSNNHSSDLIVELQSNTRNTTVVSTESIAGAQYVANGATVGNDSGLESGEEDNAQEGLDMTWPNTSRKQITYVLVAPILFPLWLTLPDTRTQKGKKFFAITFIGSICWIAAYSYLMVWWANVVGDTVQLPPEVMGLTFLAAGTSIPDLITSVIVARKGFGDMAVSSSVGSNIFDVTVGLPVPWLLYGLIYGAPVEVNSVGMVCSIAILFCMLIFVILSIAFFKWRMNKGLGFTMFMLYFVFVTISLMFEYEIIVCPV